MTPQNQLAFLVEVKPEKMEDLETLLTQIAKDPPHNTIFPFSYSKTTHFARWVIIPGQEDGTHYLIFSSNFDGQSRRKHLEDWFDVNEAGFDTILGHCKLYDPAASKRQKVRLLCKQFKNPAAFYIGTRGHSLQDIERDFQLRDYIRDFLDTKDYQIGEEQQVVKDIKEFIKSSEFSWAAEKSNYPLGYRLKKGLEKVYDFIRLGLLALLLLTGLLGIVIIPILLMINANTYLIVALSLLTLFTIYILVKLRVNEIRDGVDHTRISLPDAESLGGVEDIYLQNQMTHLVMIKPGRFRAVLGRLALWGIYVLAKHVFNKGTLGGIPSIHFARWIVVDKRLLFFSNFDASWMNYLGDFIDKASLGLTAAWSSTMGFPKTRFLAFGGATMANRFKRWARNLQIPTQVWYSAYPNYSVENINNNAKIRQGLSENLSSDKKRREWLARF